MHYLICRLQVVEDNNIFLSLLSYCSLGMSAIIWTCSSPQKKYQSSSNVLVEKWGQLSGSSHFIQNAEFTILNMLKTVVSQIIKYIISSSNFMIWPIWWSTLCEVLVDQLMGSFGDFNQGALCTCMPLPINILNFFFLVGMETLERNSTCLQA